MPTPLPLTYHLVTPAAPVQVEGRIAGQPFCFRARHDAWYFVVATCPDGEPSALDASCVARGDGWWAEGQIGAPRAAASSWLSEAETRALIEGCARAYLADMHG